MKLLILATTCLLLCGTHAAYLSIEDHSTPWTSFHDITHEGLLLTPPPHDLDAHYICDVVIENKDAFQISVHSESPDNWIATPMTEKDLPAEYVTLINDHLKASTGLPTGTSNRAHPPPRAHYGSSTAPMISCKRHINQRPASLMHQRVGFMHLIDLLSILGVGFFAAAMSGAAAVLRRRDHLKRRPVTVLDAKYASRLLDHLHELPSVDNRVETEYVLNYLQSKLR